MKTASELLTLGEAYEEKGDYLKAQRLYRKALTVQERISGCAHPDLLPFIYNLGFIHCALDNIGEAELLLGRYIDIQRRELGEDHQDICEIRDLLSSLRAPDWSCPEQGVSCA